MLKTLSASWCLRRVAIICGRSDVVQPLDAWLTLLGALTILLPPDADAQTLYRAFTSGRISAVIVSNPPASDTLLREIRETGVPLTLLCAPGDGEDAALGVLMDGVRFFTEGE